MNENVFGARICFTLKQILATKDEIEHNGGAAALPSRNRNLLS